jgi:hypothetical protein
MSINYVSFHICGYLAMWDTHMVKCIFIFFWEKKKKKKKRKKKGIFSHLP